jgi:hypothetical protein
MAKSYPFGVGIGNFVYVAPKYIQSNLLDIVVSGTSYANTHAESMYLTQLIENGWLGFLAFLGIVTSATIYSWRLFLNLSNVESGVEKSLQTAMFAAWMSLSISMITTYGYNNIGIAMLFWFLVGFSMLSQYKLHLISVKNPVGSASLSAFSAQAS